MRLLEAPSTVSSPSSRSSASSDNHVDDGHRSPMSTDHEEEAPVNGDELTDASWSDVDDRSELPTDEDDEAFSRSVGRVIRLQCR